VGVALAETSFDDQFEELHRVAYRVGFRLLGRHEMAQDVAQEALTRAFVHWWRVARHPDPAAWVAKVAANLAADVWRRRSTPVPPPQPVDTTAHERLVELRVELHEALRRLPRRQREVIVLRFLADLPERAVAAALGCSAGSAKQHASRALAALRAHMHDGNTEVLADV
jgi:RNA polymerase sigma-70 factor (sigma-E family)